MATNTGNGSRKGAVKNRVQYFSAHTGHYIKKDSETGLILEVKEDGQPFKGVRKLKTNAKSRIEDLPYEVAAKLEKAVIEVKNLMIRERIEHGQ
jgi:hypothetical protein